MHPTIRQIESSSELTSFHWDEGELRRLFQVLDNHSLSEAVPPGALSIAFIGNKRSQELHGQFFDDLSPTDVMTFPGVPEANHAGDIAANVEAAQAEASEAGWSPTEELVLYLVHGWLHLAGFRDDNAPSIAAMRHAEAQLLQRVREENALPHFQF